MKKIVTNIAALFLLLFAGTLVGQAQSRIYGDVNGDGEVNIADVNAVIGVILGGYQTNGILGCWYSEYFVDGDGRYDVPEPIAVCYEFKEDYTGRYSYRDKDDIVYLGLRWNLQGQRLYVWYGDGVYEELYVKIDENGYMLMSLDAHFDSYTAYRPINDFITSGNGVAATDAGKVSNLRTSGTAMKSVSRAIKERVK